MDMKRIPIRYLSLCAMFAALSAAGAFIRIPLPVIPFTLQTFFVLLSGILLGPKWGMLSQLVYVLVGLIGFPVFTKGGGIGYFLEPSFGFLIGFIFAAYTAGKCAQLFKTPTLIHLSIACVSGILVSYVFGCLHMFGILRFYLGKETSLWEVIWTGALVFAPKDILISLATAVIGVRTLPVLKKAGLIGAAAA